MLGYMPVVSKMCIPCIFPLNVSSVTCEEFEIEQQMSFVYRSEQAQREVRESVFTLIGRDGTEPVNSRGRRVGKFCAAVQRERVLHHFVTFRSITPLIAGTFAGLSRSARAV